MLGPAATDADLVRRCRAGDQDAWSELVHRYSRYVAAIARDGFRLREADAEEVFQEVFTRVYRHLDRLRDDAALRPWIAQLTRRVCLDRLRSPSREDLSETAPDSAVVDERLERLAEAMTVRDALGDLPEHCGEVIDRFFVRDESYETISAALGIPFGTIASRIRRCLDKLRALLEPPLHTVEGR